MVTKPRKPRPPRSILIATPHFEMYSDIGAHDALTYACFLIGDLRDLLGKHYLTGKPETDPYIIKNAAYAAYTSLDLIQHALANFPSGTGASEDDR